MPDCCMFLFLICVNSVFHMNNQIITTSTSTVDDIDCCRPFAGLTLYLIQINQGYPQKHRKRALHDYGVCTHQYSEVIIPPDSYRSRFYKPLAPAPSRSVMPIFLMPLPYFKYFMLYYDTVSCAGMTFFTQKLICVLRAMWGKK